VDLGLETRGGWAGSFLLKERRKNRSSEGIGWGCRCLSGGTSYHVLRILPLEGTGGRDKNRERDAPRTEVGEAWCLPLNPLHLEEGLAVRVKEYGELPEEGSVSRATTGREGGGGKGLTGRR